MDYGVWRGGKFGKSISLRDSRGCPLLSFTIIHRESGRVHENAKIMIRQ
jgi:hypothetical protein